MTEALSWLTVSGPSSDRGDQNSMREFKGRSILGNRALAHRNDASFNKDTISIRRGGVVNE